MSMRMGVLLLTLSPRDFTSSTCTTYEKHLGITGARNGV